MSEQNTTSKFMQNGVVKWIEHRMPIFSFIDHSVGSGYPAPKNLSYWWNFGSLAGLALIIMIVSGIVLAMHYTPHTTLAFSSVERIMRDVNGGWLIRYLHMNGASFFFIVVYLHIFRGLFYFLQGSARDDLAARRSDLPADDGDRVHGLRPALGSDELLGCQGHYRPVRRHPAGWRADPDLAARRVREIGRAHV